MGAVAVWTWVGAVVLGLVILGFCAYEIIWKLRRLGRDVEDLQGLQTRLAALQRQVATAQTTAATIQRQRAHNAHRNGDALFPHPRDPRPAEAGQPA
ncbi:hypothetical protein ACXR2U_14445 [Jatrophihabitans sp. YIM 134969]